MGFPCPNPPLPSQKVKLFIHGAILLKFETEYFHMLTNNNLDYSLKMEVPLLPSPL